MKPFTVRFEGALRDAGWRADIVAEDTAVGSITSVSRERLVDGIMAWCAEHGYSVDSVTNTPDFRVVARATAYGAPR